MLRRIRNVFLGLAALVVLALSALFVIAKVYGTEVKVKLVGALNERLLTPVTVSDMDLTLISRFPRASMRLRDVKIDEVRTDGAQPDTLLAARELFRGTLAQTSVYPREVVKAALAENAAGVIFAHNHPSGVAEPSRADELLTVSLKSALALVDIRTLDHFVVAGHRVVSFAERGLL